MKKILIICFLLGNSLSLNAQYNLVPNPSFEQYDTCPNWVGQIYYAVPWANSNNASPDYFNACSTIFNSDVPANYAGFEPARTGVGYAAIITCHHEPVLHYLDNYREYLQVELNDSLLSGVDYCITFYVSACDSNGLVSNNIGIYFSQAQIFIPNIYALPYTPQFENVITNNLNSRNGWTMVSGAYTALGGEKFIVIGNFRDTTTTVSTLTGWTINPGYLSQGEYYIDDVLISPCDSLTAVNDLMRIDSDVNVFPTVAENKLNIRSNEQVCKIEIFSQLGNLILSKRGINKREITIDISSISNGIYIIKIFNDKKQFTLKFIKK